jgi:RNA polymerase sigma factor (sigma-70 family)
MAPTATWANAGSELSAPGVTHRPRTRSDVRLFPKVAQVFTILLSPHKKMPGAGTGIAPVPSPEEVDPPVEEVTLHALRPSATGPDRASWQDRVQSGTLHERTLEEVVAVCRRLDPERDERLLGELMAHVSVMATRYLAKRVSANRPNGGKDALDNVRSGMLAAILDPEAADGLGYETAFYPKLRQRLIDELRREDKRRQRYEPFAQDEAGEEIEPPDTTALSPEQTAIMHDLIERLPDDKRKAYQLRRAGFEYFSEDQEVPTIASLLHRSDKTARKWVAEAENLISQELGRQP